MKQRSDNEGKPTRRAMFRAKRVAANPRYRVKISPELLRKETHGPQLLPFQAGALPQSSMESVHAPGPNNKATPNHGTEAFQNFRRESFATQTLAVSKPHTHGGLLPRTLSNRGTELPNQRKTVLKRDVFVTAAIVHHLQRACA